MANKTAKDTKTKTKKTSKTVKSKKTKSTEKKSQPVSSTESSVPVPVTVDVSTSTKSTTTPESVLELFETLVSEIETEIQSARESKTSGVKFLRSINKQVKSLKGKVTTVFRQKRKIKRTSSENKNSGFLKPVKISKEMSSFTGWKPDELHSRVEVTKALCKYIKDNDLQDPSDRRNIKPDAKLAKLLNYKDKKEPLTYFRIQSCLKEHFPKK